MPNYASFSHARVFALYKRLFFTTLPVCVPLKCPFICSSGGSLQNGWHISQWPHRINIRAVGRTDWIWLTRSHRADGTTQWIYLALVSGKSAKKPQIWIVLRFFMRTILWLQKINNNSVCSFNCTMWSAGLHSSHTCKTLSLSWCCFCPLHSQSSTDFDCDKMSLLKRRKIRTVALLFCILTFTTFLFSYTLRDPSLYFFKYAFRLSDNFFSKGPCACRQCMAELEDDTWFAERFNQSIHPLMTRENSALSDETFKWWQVRFTDTLLTQLVITRCFHHI